MKIEDKVWSSEWIYMRLESLGKGVKECAGPPDPAIVVHIGNSLALRCDFEGRRHHGLRIHGDANVIPAQMPSRWETGEDYTELSIRLPRKLIDEIAHQSDLDPGQVELREQFHLRDPRLRHVSLALKAEFEAGFPNGRLFSESLANALGVLLIHQHSNVSPTVNSLAPKISAGRLRRVLSFIDDNIGNNLSLADVVGVIGLSISHCKTVFRNTMGTPIHQYVLLRRVERARYLLNEGKHSITEVALMTGFSSPSHLAFHVRRAFGVTPHELLKARKKK
jgi:AraC family transcriptional regulator